MSINIMKFEKYGTHIGVVKSKKSLFDTEQAFLDFMIQVREEADADIIIIEKTVLPEKFFDLKSGFAGMMHQKIVNHMIRMAIVGDFSEYKDTTIGAYIDECNDKKGELVFLRSVNEAITFLVG